MLINRSTRRWAAITVLWLRRPKNSPISLQAARVYFRASHIASIRGSLTERPFAIGAKLRGLDAKHFAHGLLHIAQPNRPRRVPHQFRDRSIGQLARNRLLVRLAHRLQSTECST